jgi:multicomponent Na+:H+ antiporter subunit E
MKRLNEGNEAPRAKRTFSFRSVISWAFLIRVVFFSIFWALLVRWQQSSLGVGIVFITIASLLSLYLAQGIQQKNQWLRSPLNLLSFLQYFIVQSLLGGWTIAKLALTAKPNLAPGFITYYTNLANESQVLTFMQVLSLLPGTVSAKQNGPVITIHVMNMNEFDHAEIDDCQLRISKLLGTPVQPFGEEKK